jgi:hypothetical protein
LIHVLFFKHQYPTSQSSGAGGTADMYTEKEHKQGKAQAQAMLVSEHKRVNGTYNVAFCQATRHHQADARSYQAWEMEQEETADTTAEADGVSFRELATASASLSRPSAFEFIIHIR